MDNIIVLVGKFTRLCIAIIKIFFSVVVTLMVLWAMQRLNMLPVFERCERGVLTPDNPDWEGYWQSQGLIPSCNADLEEDTLITNFGLVLQKKLILNVARLCLFMVIWIIFHCKALFSTTPCIQSNDADSQPEDEIRKWEFIMLYCNIVSFFYIIDQS